MTNHTSPQLLEIKRANLTETGQFSGLASDWETEPDSQGDIIHKGAFQQALEYHRKQNTRPAFLWSHKAELPLGHWISVRETERGLEVTGQLNLDVAKAREVYSLMKTGSIGLSIGFMLSKDGAAERNGVREILDIARLPEISAVALPANSRARIHEIKQSPRAFEKAPIERIGLSRREAKRAVAGGYSRLVCDERAINLEDVIDRIDRLQKTIDSRGI